MSEKERKSAGASRLGKEAKIGALVISVLLAILGAVVAIRVMSSSSGDRLAAATDADSDNARTALPSKTASLPKDGKSKLFGGNSPTIVPATAAAKPPKTLVGELDKWKLAADRRASKPLSTSAANLSEPPSFMPDPPKPPHADRSERFASAPPLANDADEPKPLREKGNELRLGSPENAASTRTEKRYADRYDSGSRAASDSSPPRYREASRYDDVTSPQPSATIPVAQFDASDYRRESAPSKRYGAATHRSPAHNNPPPRRDDGRYEVQPNDSYWTISERLYGTGSYFKALAQHNRGEGGPEDRLQPGTLILAPDMAQLEKSYPDLCPKSSRREAMQSQTQSRLSSVGTRNSYRGGRTYTVVEGDTLFNIARYELGKASRWAEIYDLNRDVLGKDFNYLTPGTQLALPDGGKSDTLAQPPSNTYRR